MRAQPERNVAEAHVASSTAAQYSHARHRGSIARPAVAAKCTRSRRARWHPGAARSAARSERRSKTKERTAEKARRGAALHRAERRTGLGRAQQRAGEGRIICRVARSRPPHIPQPAGRNMEDEADIREQLFHNTVREYIIFLLLFLLLYVSSYALISRFRWRAGEDYLAADEDEATVYRISLWLCASALAVSIGATLLLPVSTASNEVLILYPDSYYVKWLNSSLVQGLWNLVFLFSNMSLFVFLPFAYLFTESEGFVGYRKGVMARVYETATVLCLLGAMVLGMTYILSAILDRQKSSLHTLHNVWSYYLPFLYSCVSFVGVVLLLLCTPVGFVRLFGLVGSSLGKPQLPSGLDEELAAHRLEEQCARRRLERAATPRRGLARRLEELRRRRRLLDGQRRSRWLRRGLVYPAAMLGLLLFGAATALLALQNALQLLAGIKALPLSTSQFTLGISSLYRLGPLGATVEVALVLYLAGTSAVGLYTLPGVRRVRPRLRATPLTHLIANCALLLVLSSALPLISRIIGLTNFDLLGDFGRIEWLGNFKLVLFYNVVFAAATLGCLATKFTATVRKEIYARLRGALFSVFGRGRVEPAYPSNKDD